MTEEKEIDVIEAVKKIPLDWILWAGFGFIAGLLMLACYNKGYADGYIYVENWMEDYIDTNCFCTESAPERPIEATDIKIEIPEDMDFG